MKREKVRTIIREELERAKAFSIPSEYPPHYSILTVHFADGSEPQAVSIPYKPFENRADVHLPIRVVKEPSDV